MANSCGLPRTANALGSEGHQAAVTPFTFHAPQNELDDLKLRLTHTRFPDRETGPGWSEGVPLDKLRGLVEYWRTAYDWRRCESMLNSFPQYRTSLCLDSHSPINPCSADGTWTASLTHGQN